MVRKAKRKLSMNVPRASTPCAAPAEDPGPAAAAAPAAEAMQPTKKRSRLLADLEAFNPDGGTGLAGTLAVEQPPVLPNQHQVVLPMANHTRVIVFKLCLPAKNLGRRKGWSVEVECPLCEVQFEQMLNDWPEGKECPAARAHLDSTIGQRQYYSDFDLHSPGVNTCELVYQWWNAMLHKHNMDRGDHLQKYVYGRELCVPMFGHEFQFTKTAEAQAKERQETGVHSLLPSGMDRGSMSQAGMSSPNKGPPHWASTPTAVRSVPIEQPASLNGRQITKSTSRKPYPKPVTAPYGHNPTPYCSCALRHYDGSGIFRDVSIHDIDCECKLDLNGDFQCHWELSVEEASPARVQRRERPPSPPQANVHSDTPHHSPPFMPASREGRIPW